MVRVVGSGTQCPEASCNHRHSEHVGFGLFTWLHRCARARLRISANAGPFIAGRWYHRGICVVLHFWVDFLIQINPKHTRKKGQHGHKR